MSTILLTNDDGIDALGLRSLEESLRGVADLVVVAPDRERSAVSHGLTLHSPLALNEVDTNRFNLNGTPADCVIYALNHVVADRRPNLVISGINHGANLGEDVMYSGTVAAAREASRHGIPAIAVSQAYDDKPIRFKLGARFIRRLVENLLGHNSIQGLCLNVNIPVRRIRGVRVTRQACQVHSPQFNSLDKKGVRAVCPDTESPRRSEFLSDFQAIVDHFISITPLHRDQTDYATAQSLVREAPELFQTLRLPGNWVDRVIKLG